MKLPKKRKTIINIVSSVCVTLSFLAVLYLIREIFAHDVSDFTVEILAVVLGAIIVVASTSVIIRLQASQEIEREYSAKVFEQKLTIYLELLQYIFKADDNNYFSKNEIAQIENRIARACLIANSNLVWRFSQFMYQLKTYGIMYYCSMNQKQKQHFASYVDTIKSEEASLFASMYPHRTTPLDIEDYFVSLDRVIQGIRENLLVVDGDINKNIERFIKMPYNEQNLIEKRNNNRDTKKITGKKTQQRT